MPRGGKRDGAGRPSGTGRYREPATSMRIPQSLVGEVSEMLAVHARRAIKTPNQVTRPKKGRLISIPKEGEASIIGPITARKLLEQLIAQKTQAKAVILDPFYRAKRETGRAAYLAEVIQLLDLASQVAPHVFIWGFPESVARLVDHWPDRLKLEGWLTWVFRNAPSRSRSWRPTQQACLHLRRKDGRLHPEAFYSERHRAIAATGKLEYKMTPFSVFDEALLSGFIKRSEQTGYPMQKPESVIEPLIRMSTLPGDLIIDPTCGSGTSGAVAVKLGRRAILSDRSAAALKVTKRRIADIAVSAPHKA